MLSRIPSQSLNVWASAIQAASENHKLKRYRGEGEEAEPLIAALSLQTSQLFVRLKCCYHTQADVAVSVSPSCHHRFYGAYMSDGSSFVVALRFGSFTSLCRR